MNKRFEDNFAKYFTAKHALAFWKGRVAMYAILKALEIKNDDEVVLPGYTCVMDVNPIKYLGAKPVYVDIEPNTFNINPALLESKITAKTKLIVAQHTYGYPCDMDAIMNIAAQRSITVYLWGQNIKAGWLELLALPHIFPSSGTNPSLPDLVAWF